MEVANSFSALAGGTAAVFATRVRFFQQQGYDSSVALSSGAIMATSSWIVTGVLFLVSLPFAWGSIHLEATGTVQEVAEAFQAAFGGQPLPADPVPGGCQCPRDQLVGADPAGFHRGDKAGLRQDAQVLDDRRECHVERPGQLAH